MTRDQIIAAIQDCAQEIGLSPATITGRAVGNSRLYARMIEGGDCTTETAGRLMEFISKSRAQQQEGASP